MHYTLALRQNPSHRVHGCTSWQRSSSKRRARFSCISAMPLPIDLCHVSIRRPHYQQITTEMVSRSHSLILDDIQTFTCFTLVEIHRCPHFLASDMRPDHHRKHAILLVHTMYQGETVREPACGICYMQTTASLPRTIAIITTLALFFFISGALALFVT